MERITKIVSEYTKIPVDQLRPETHINRAVIGNSIILHRMYAAIAKEGVEIQGYQDIKTFGELVNKISGNPYPASSAMPGLEIVAVHRESSHEKQGIGIDIEEISKMPQTVDFREEEFYTMNFTPEEIAYCILQPDQYASFAGLFAAKEAIIKADNNYKKITFNKIFVDHLPGGQPLFDGFNISISHTRDFSVAVAVKNLGSGNINSSYQKDTIIQSKDRSSLPVAIVAIILAVIAICIIVFK